jgi:hypothetical protein
MFKFVEDESVYAIQCGYFNKIVQSLMNKTKMQFLEYMIIKRKGDIF